MSRIGDNRSDVEISGWRGVSRVPRRGGIGAATSLEAPGGTRGYEGRSISRLVEIDDDRTRAVWKTDGVVSVYWMTLPSHWETLKKG